MTISKNITDVNGNPVSFGHRSKPSEIFPNGEPVTDGTEPVTLIICLSDKHRQEVASAFKMRAMHILPGGALAGRQFDKIVIFTPPMADGLEFMRFKTWIDEAVLTKRKVQGIVHYV